MKSSKIFIQSLNELPEAAKGILHFAQTSPEAGKVFAVYGAMGAGKTTLVKEICRQLGSIDNFSSPTYSIVNEYLANEGKKIYHIDLYRLKNLNEALDLGIEDYMDGQHYCFIEWPELISPLLPVNLIKVNIQLENNLREISIFIK